MAVNTWPLLMFFDMQTAFAAIIGVDVIENKIQKLKLIINFISIDSKIIIIYFLEAKNMPKVHGV